MDIIRLKTVLITRGEQGSLKLKRLTNIASAFEAHSLPEIFEFGHDENCPIHQSELGISFKRNFILYYLNKQSMIYHL